MRRLLVTCLLLPAALAAGPSAAADEAAGAGKSLPFLSDDYGAALAEARARQVPIFVEAWAPW